MGLITEENGQIHDDVKFHTRQKHQFLEKYLEIWVDNVSGKKSKPTLDIFDLYSSTGSCLCSNNKEVWDGSAIISAKCLKKYPKGRNLILNSYNDKDDEKKLQIDGLTSKLESLNLPSRVNVQLFSLPIEEAITQAIKYVDPLYPSLWILDPYQPQQLPWSQVQRITTLKGKFINSKGKEEERIPELFIVLITETLQRSSRKDDQMHIVDEALGIERKIWQEKLEYHESQGLNKRQAINEIYAERLFSIYGKNPIILEVEGTEGNIIYTIFFLSQHRAGYYMMLLRKIPEFETWKLSEWKPKAKSISKVKKAVRKAEDCGMIPGSLFDYGK